LIINCFLFRMGFQTFDFFSSKSVAVILIRRFVPFSYAVT